MDFWLYSKSQFPELCKIAQSIFLIPASSSALERTFSIVSGNIRKDRNRLSAKTLETILQVSAEDQFSKALETLE